MLIFIQFFTFILAGEKSAYFAVRRKESYLIKNLNRIKKNCQKSVLISKAKVFLVLE